MPLLDNGPSRTLDPLQSILAHLPDPGYGLYEGACTFLWNEPSVPMEIKEGLRFLSASRIGCAYCRTVRENDFGGRRLLPDDFYSLVASGTTDWENLVGQPWAGLFELADEILEHDEASKDTIRHAKHSLSQAQIVEGIFFMLLIGASHRFSRAFGIEESCEIPTRIMPS